MKSVIKYYKCKADNGDGFDIGCKIDFELPIKKIKQGRAIDLQATLDCIHYAKGYAEGFMRSNMETWRTASFGLLHSQNLDLSEGFKCSLDGNVASPIIYPAGGVPKNLYKMINKKSHGGCK